VLDFVSEAALVEVEQVVQCDFDLISRTVIVRPNSPGAPRAMAAFVGVNAIQHLLVSVVSCRFEVSINDRFVISCLFVALQHLR